MSREQFVRNDHRAGRHRTGRLRNYVLSKGMKIISLMMMMFFSAFAPAGSPASAADSPQNIVVLGDSLVAGYGLGPGESFPEKLQSALREKNISANIANAGVSGDTTTGGLARLDWSVPDGTDAVILELGANDALRGIPPEVTRQNLDTMIVRLKDRGIAVLLAGMMAPPNMGDDYAAAFNPIYAELAARHDIALYPFFLDGVAGETALNQQDGMHPTAEGVDMIVDRFLSHMQAFLDQLRQ